MESNTPIRYIKGVGEARGECFLRLGVTNAGELSEFFPRTYEDRSKIVNLCDTIDGETYAVIAEVISASNEKYSKSGIVYLKIMVSDGTGELELIFFNQAYLKNVLTVGRKFRFYGRVNYGMYTRQMTSPSVESIYEGKALKNIIAVYPLTKGLTSKIVSDCVEKTLPIISNIESVLPASVIAEHGLFEKRDAVRIMHFPNDAEELVKAKRTLAFEELTVFQCALRILKSGCTTLSSYAYSFEGTGISRFFKQLPFALTGAQERVIKEVFEDLCRERAMTRMVIGDVGSGKTVVAAAALFFTAMQHEKMQAAFMAPTEILATQHYATLTKMLSSFGITIAFLTGSTPKKEKAQIKEGLSNGSIDIVVGTHALITENVSYKRLGLAVTDEQHRFGVMQRAALADKSEGKQAHTLVMSATPIPRTLSLILYGDMDISVIDELPPGRKKIDTFAVDESYRERLNDFMRKNIREGGQIYVICPLVEENEESEKKSVEAYAEKLRCEVFASMSDVRVEAIHGKMASKKKAEVMDAFKEGKVSVLVSTTVIEVGVDVPNANVMVIENAECFGLSQLHQLRGRIGRGSRKSFCILFSDIKNEKSLERLKVIASTDNGFDIANEDLKLRGPGDFFGERQSGEILFKTASLADMELIEETKKLCDDIFRDKLLDTEQYGKLKESVSMFFQKQKSKNMVN